jgi:hypothetical protein
MDENQIIPSADQIWKTLFVGNQAAAESAMGIQFDAIVNVTKHVRCPHARWGVKYLCVPINDPGPGADKSNEDVRHMIQFLPEIIKYIDKHIQEGKKVLVHCHAGAQRSAFVAAVYLCYRGITKDIRTAIQYVARKRPVAFFGGRKVSFINACPSVYL